MSGPGPTSSWNPPGANEIKASGLSDRNHVTTIPGANTLDDSNDDDYRDGAVTMRPFDVREYYSSQRIESVSDVAKRLKPLCTLRIINISMMRRKNDKEIKKKERNL